MKLNNAKNKVKLGVRKLAFNRAYIVGLFILLQLLIIFCMITEFTKLFFLYFLISSVLAAAFVLQIINSNQNMAYKLAWIVVIMLFPAFGAAIYTIFCGNRISVRTKEKMNSITAITETAVDKNIDVSEKLRQLDPAASVQSDYIRNTCMCPLYENCETVYFESGEKMLGYLLAELEKAESYIFLEYFIIERGLMWDSIHDILKRKADSGVDVRIIYDDMGCIATLNRKFAPELEAEGIKCRVFHKFIPVLTARQNNRDHRKICVIDGKCAFTGGVNLADEYINNKQRFGYWKDTAVMLRGGGAWSFTVMFLTMWDYLCRSERKSNEAYKEYRNKQSEIPIYHNGGFVQPYADNPLDYEPVGENVYLGIISASHSYVWIMTPYLIIDEQMEQTLCRAAKSGIDVRIITPGIPDKKLVNETTKSYYPNLINSGVKIYEFTPGFLHAKGFICDDTYASVGSINLDYRSLYLHFECGLWMYKPNCIDSIKSDFENTFSRSRLVENLEPGVLRKMFRGILEFLAPLL